MNIPMKQKQTHRQREQACVCPGVGDERGLGGWDQQMETTIYGFPGGSDGTASAYNAGDQGLIPGLGRSPGEGNGIPLQYSCLENPMDRGAWQAMTIWSQRVRHD